jgi:hypothetical protein
MKLLTNLRIHPKSLLNAAWHCTHLQNASMTWTENYFVSFLWHVHYCALYFGGFFPYPKMGVYVVTYSVHCGKSTVDRGKNNEKYLYRSIVKSSPESVPLNNNKTHTFSFLIIEKPWLFVVLLYFTGNTFQNCARIKW